MSQALLKIMEPEINKIKEEAANKERQKGIKSTIVALRICGQEDATIKNAIMEAYGISAKEAEEYL